METRKRSKAASPSPALLIFSNSNNIPNISQITYIKDSKFTIGRSSQASLVIVHKNVSRSHCTLNRMGTNRWTIESSNRGTTLLINGQQLRPNEQIFLKCGDRIEIKSAISFEFLCSPDQNMQCSLHFKKPKLTETDVYKIDEDNSEETSFDGCVTNSAIPELNEHSISYNDTEIITVDLDHSSEFVVPLSPDVLGTSRYFDSVERFSPDVLGLARCSDFIEPSSSDVLGHARCSDFVEPTSPDVLSILSSQPLNDDVNADTLPATEILDDTSETVSATVSENTSSRSRPDDLENAIQKYTDYVEANASNLNNEESTMFNPKLIAELKFRLNYMKELHEFNQFNSIDCPYTKNENLDDICSAMAKFSSFFKEKYSLFNTRNNSLKDTEEKNPHHILFNLDALLIDNTSSVIYSICKLLDNAVNLHKRKCPSRKTLLEDKYTDTINIEKERGLEDSSLKEREKKINEEFAKHKENEEALQTRIRYLEIKLKEKSTLEKELEATKVENERLEREVAGLKRNLAKMEIVELEYKCLQERTKYKEDDKRNKDALERKINTLQNDVSTLKTENEKVLSNNLSQESEITELKKKIEDLELKLKSQSMLKYSNTTCSTNIGNDDCCEIVKTVKESLNDLMEAEFKCSICDDLLVDTTVTNCSHVFCAYCLKLWKENKGKNCFCPLCRTKLTSNLYKAPVIDEFINNLTKLVCDESVQTERTNRINERKGFNQANAAKMKPPRNSRGRQAL